MLAMYWTRNLNRSHLLTGLVMLSIVSCLVWPRGFAWPRELLAPVLAPLSDALTYASTSIKGNLRGLTGGAADDETARRMLEEDEPLRQRLSNYVDQTLQRQVLSYEAQLADQQRRLDEMGQWRKYLPPGFPCKLLAAKVIGQGPTPFQREELLVRKNRLPGGATWASKGDFVTMATILTDRPTAIPGELAVLSGSAVVGQIVTSGAWTAHLQLITDPDFKIKAFVYRQYDAAHPRTIEAEEMNDGKSVPTPRSLRPTDPPVPVNLAGNLTGLISAEVPAQHGIRPGDHVRTMGDDVRLPVGVFIGYVRAVTPSPANPKHVRLEVAPASDLQSLRDVYIVVPMASGGQ
jgi:hypothetical protein